MQTLSEFDAQFSNDDACKQFLVDMRWPDGVRCPRCDNPSAYKLNFKPWHWQCKICQKNGYRFSCHHRHDLSGYQNSPEYLVQGRLSDVDREERHQRPANSPGYLWRKLTPTTTQLVLCHRWRAAMRGEMYKLDGLVEVDETYSAERIATAIRGTRAPISARPGKPRLCQGRSDRGDSSQGQRRSASHRLLTDAPTLSKLRGSVPARRPAGRHRREPGVQLRAARPAP